MRVDDPTLSIVAEGLNDLPAPFELVNIGDELEDFRRNRNVFDVGHALYPFSPIYTRFVAEI